MKESNDNSNNRGKEALSEKERIAEIFKEPNELLVQINEKLEMIISTIEKRNNEQ